MIMHVSGYKLYISVWPTLPYLSEEGVNVKEIKAVGCLSAPSCKSNFELIHVYMHLRRQLEYEASLQLWLKCFGPTDAHLRGSGRDQS